MTLKFINVITKWLRRIFNAVSPDAIFDNIKGLPSKFVETLTAEEVVRYFKSDDIHNKLQSNDGYIAVAIRRKAEHGYDAVLCIYDTNKNNIVDSRTSAQIICAKQFDHDLEAFFGGKDMLVLS